MTYIKAAFNSIDGDGYEPDTSERLFGMVPDIDHLVAEFDALPEVQARTAPADFRVNEGTPQGSLGDNDCRTEDELGADPSCLTQRPVAKVCYLDGHYEAGLQATILEPDLVHEDMYLFAARPLAQPVLYQLRIRPICMPEGQGWTEWKECSADSYHNYPKTGTSSGWQYETRALCIAETETGHPMERWVTRVRELGYADIDEALNALPRKGSK